ncbi:MAG TPA: hypothetical protein HA304_03865 [Methanosarcinales archaeon]|nr:hypothetical protein [Methanosarcinales archaeon]
MNTKMNKMVLLSALTIVIIGTIGAALAGEPGEQTVDLIAGGGGDEGLDVGNVTVWNNSENIFVKFTTTGDWLFNETHLHIAAQGDVETPAEEIPQTKKGNPKPGKFDYSTEHESCITEYTYEISLDDIPDSDILVIAAHAAVELEVEELGEIIIFEESAWGNGTEFAEDRNWAMYFTYMIPSE